MVYPGRGPKRPKVQMIFEDRQTAIRHLEVDELFAYLPLAYELRRCHERRSTTNSWHSPNRGPSRLPGPKGVTREAGCCRGTIVDLLAFMETRFTRTCAARRFIRSTQKSTPITARNPRIERETATPVAPPPPDEVERVAVGVADVRAVVEALWIDVVEAWLEVASVTAAAATRGDEGSGIARAETMRE